MSITHKFRLHNTKHLFNFAFQAGLFLALCLWHTALSAQELENITLVEHNIESPPFVEGQSIDGINGWTTNFPTRPLLFTDRANDPTSVLFGTTSGAITIDSSNSGSGGSFPDFTVPKEARTLTINMSGRFRSDNGFQTNLQLFGDVESNLILNFGALGFTNSTLPLNIVGTDFDFQQVNRFSEDQHSQFAQRSLDLTLFYDQRTGIGTVTANNLLSDRSSSAILRFSDSFLVSELGTVRGNIFVGDSESAISAFNIQVGVVSVPEPSSSTALACLSPLVLRRRRRK